MGKKGIVIMVVALIGISLLLPAKSHAWRGWYGRGWYGPGFFAGGLVVGAALARPWYVPPPVYVYPQPAVVYAAPPPVYAPPPPAYTAPGQGYVYQAPPAQPPAMAPAPAPPPAMAPAPAPESRGQWVEVPGQTVNGRWVPEHKAWVPDGE
jgi:hypothetical protein